MAQSGLAGSFLAAIQANLSVLLVIFYGGIAAHFKLLSSTSAKAISKTCVQMFLPALLLTQIGSELHSGSAHRYLIILLWALICHFVSFLIGIGAHLLLGMPDWITAAIMFNNTTSYPLLLIQSLDQTGILSSLIVTDESTREAIERAKSYFLVFATVSSCLTFAVGPRLIDSEHGPDQASYKGDLEDDDDNEAEAGAAGGERRNDDREQLPTAQTQLLDNAVRRVSAVPVSFFPSQPRQSSSTVKPTINYNRRPSGISKRRWLQLTDRSRWWLLFLWDFVNAPLVGAVLGAIIGLVPVLHRAFFNNTQDGGIFTAWLTASLKNVGSVFLPLPVMIAGVSLYNCRQKSANEENSNHGGGTPWLTTTFILIIRFVIWPIVSIGVVYLLATKYRSNAVVRDDVDANWATSNETHYTG